MEEEIYKLEVIMKIRDAISNTYNEISDSSKYHECMEFINECERAVIEKIKD